MSGKACDWLHGWLGSFPGDHDQPMVVAAGERRHWPPRIDVNPKRGQARQDSAAICTRGSNEADDGRTGVLTVSRESGKG